MEQIKSRLEDHEYFDIIVKRIADTLITDVETIYGKVHSRIYEDWYLKIEKILNEVVNGNNKNKNYQ